MQRLRSTFKRSRTPTGNEMKSQSSLEVPKQVRSASFDEIQLEAQRQESSASSSNNTNAELRSIASIAMATSSGLAVSSALSSSSSTSSAAAAAAAAASSSSSSWSNQYQGWGGRQQRPPPPPTPPASSGRTSQSPLPSWSEHFAQLHGAGASAAASAAAATSTSTLLRRSANTLRPPPGGGQRSKSFDVASVGEHRHHHGHGAHGQGPSLLDRSASTTSSIALDRSGSSPSHTGYGYSRWKSSAERDNPPAQAYSCWHCACVDEYRASLQQQQQQQSHLSVGDSSSTWGDADEPDNYSYDDDYYDNDADEECDSFSGGGGIGSSGELADFEPGPLQLERDASDNSYYFVVVRKAYEDSCVGSADGTDGSELGLEAGETSAGRREGSPEIRVTLTPSTSLPESEPGVAGGFESEEVAIGGGGGGGGFDLGLPAGASTASTSSAASRQRRRSLSRQEALELPILLQVAAAESSSSGPAAAGDSSPDEDEQASPREISTTTTTDQDDGSGGTPRERAASAENPAAGLVVRDIFLTVPDLKRDRAASVDSCFNNNKNGKIETCYSLQVPQQSPRSKSVDIVLPTDVQTRYTALLPEDARFLGEKDDGGAGAGQRELRSTPDWSSTSLNGEHLWVPTAASGEFCYINDCSKHGARLKCSACRVVVHTACTSSLNFACKPSFRDVGVRQYREQKVTQHHWVHRRSQKGKCTNCAKSFQSKLSFSSKEIVAVGCSWCKQAYHNRESCFNAERIGEECRLGLHSCIMVPPSWIVKLPKRGAFKSSLRKSPKKKRGPKSKEPKEEEKEDPLKLWVVKPIPTSSVTPVLVFINPRSGGNQGAKLLQKFQWLLNPRQVFDLTQGGPKMGLELFKKVPNLRILACGGDGTVGWVLSVLDQIGANPAPAVGTLPLGTGNDLARALGWGGGYTDEPIGKILVSMAESEISILDRWQLLVERNPDASGQDEDAAKGKDNLPLNVVNNYFSLGVDAHIALEFHEAREAHPERFNSRLRNKMFYGQMGGKDLVVRRWKDLSEYVTLECDGQDVTAKLKEHRVHAILFLNIDSYGGGTHPWGGGMGRPPTTEDGLIEVVGLTTYQLPLLQAGGHGTSIAQCSTAKLVTSKTIPMQVDGEACRLLPSIINMNLLNKATMLAKRRNQGKPRQKAAEVERLRLPLMKIRMHDYETFHSDKERLIKTAQTWQSEPLELDAGMDLESLRNQLSKTLPMDNCCFLDSCTAERFFRIDRAQEQLHYVADVVSEAIYILQEGPAGSSSQAANISGQQQSQQSQQQHGDNANTSREERRKMPSGERKSRGSDTNRHQDNNNYDGGGGSFSARSRQGSNQAGSRGSLTADQQREERRRPGASEGGAGAYYDGPSKLSSNKSHHSQSGGGGHHFVQHTPGSAYISPRDRLFGLSSEVHTFSHELLERTSEGILKVAKSGDIVGLKDLHQRGYSLLSIDAQGQTALHLASAGGHKDIVRYLIACAPPIILNMVDNDKGQTALHKAAQQKKRSICCMLVAGGARLTVRDLAGNTPRELALIAEDHELAAYLQSQEQFQLMTEEGGYMS